MKVDCKSLFIRPCSPLSEAMKVIDDNATQFALVVDELDVLLGTLSDGDIRRALLKGHELSDNCEFAMNKSFRSFSCNDGYSSMQRRMKIEKIRQMPVLDDDGKVLDLVLLDEFENLRLENSVVIMAGGKGKRLRPYTENCPKPMLPVSGKPMLEILLEQCIDYGFTNFYFSVNYLKSQIIDYFQGGERWDVKIEYLEEDKPLGTAGSLRLLLGKIKKPFLVLNGDVLSRLDYSKLLRFHQEYGALATMCVRNHYVDIPFGVINHDGTKLLSFDEKPTYAYPVNAGVYVINPELIQLVNSNEFTDMPTLLQRSQDQGNPVAICPVHEYWVDVGREEALRSVQLDWSPV